MRFSDYRRMGKISLKARKKSTKNTVRGICFGLILLIPIVFFTLAFYIGLTSAVNETPTISSYHLAGKNYYDTSGKMIKRPVTESSSGSTYVSYEGVDMLDNKTLNDIAENDGVAQKVVSERYILGSNNYNSSEEGAVSITLDKTTFKSNAINGLDKWGGTTQKKHTIRAINLEKSDCLITDAEKKDFKKTQKGDIFLAGNEFTAKTLGKGEIILGMPLLTNLGATGDASSFVGKNFSLSYKLSRNSVASYYNSLYNVFENNVNILEQGGGRNISIIKNFKIVGIVSEEYYKLPSTIDENFMWISTASIYDEAGMLISGQKSLEPGEAYPDGRVGSPVVRVDYSDISQMETKAGNEKRMFVAIGAMGYTEYGRIYNYVYGDLQDNDLINFCPIDIKTQMKSYDAAYKLSAKINAEYSLINPSYDSMNQAAPKFSTEGYSSFSMINMIGNYLMLVLYSFGGIIFFATLLNLYNTINYSVQVRKNYIGVMRAIGAKQKVIPKMYFHEIVLIFLKALPWVLIFSGALSFGIKIGIDMVFKMMSEMTSIVLSLNFIYFFVTLVGMVLIVFAIAFLFSLLSCWNVSRKPILDVLSDDKG